MCQTPYVAPALLRNRTLGFASLRVEIRAVLHCSCLGLGSPPVCEKWGCRRIALLPMTDFVARVHCVLRSAFSKTRRQHL